MAKKIDETKMKQLSKKLRFTNTTHIGILKLELLNYISKNPEVNPRDWAYIILFISRIKGFSRRKYLHFKYICRLTGIGVTSRGRAQIESLIAFKKGKEKDVISKFFRV